MNEVTEIAETATKKALKDVYVIQNVLICISSYIAIGLVEFTQITHPNAMPILHCCSKWLAITSTICVFLSIIAYTFNYCKKKIIK